ncbi:MAG: DUF4340 domain-containing protein, partial [Candidatus Eremiobacterota bacterium]
IVLKIEDTEKVKSIKLKQETVEISFEKQDKTWHITSPVRALADEGMVNGLLANIGEVKSEQKLTDRSEGLSAYGLDKPCPVVTITLDDGTAKVISVGKKTFDENSYYGQIEGDKNIFTIASYVVDSYFNKPLLEYRDKTVISCTSSDVGEFEFKTGNKLVKCQKDQKNRWTIAKPFNARGDAGQIEGWINSVSALKVKDFIKEETTDMALYGLDKPFIDITLFTGKDKARKGLLIGKKDDTGGGYYAKRVEEPQLLLIEASSIDNLSKDPELWRDKSVFDVPFGDIVSFEITNGKIILSGTKDKDNNWILSKPEQKKATSWKIDTQLMNVINLKADNVISEHVKDLKKYGLDKPSMTVKIVNKDREEAVLLFGKQDKNSYYAIRQGHNMVIAAGKTLFDGLDELIKNPPYEEKEKK